MLMLLVLLTPNTPPSTDPPLWNGVTITTAIGAAIAIGLSIVAIVMSWSSQPKPHWRNESKMTAGVWRLHLVNRGRGAAHDVRLLMLLADGSAWSQIATFPERTMNEVVHTNIGDIHDGNPAVAKLKYRSHPFSWHVRTRTFKSSDKVPVIVEPQPLKPNF